MTIALFPNPNKHDAIPLAIELVAALKQHAIATAADDDFAATLNTAPLSTIAPESIRYAIAIGGDGTILRLMQTHPELQAPIIGINMGTLGFLATIPVTGMHQALHAILLGDCVVQERYMIECNGRSAVNEVAIHRGGNSSIIDLALAVDGHYLNTFSADGVIVATPSGSTAYSLSAGGPIMTTNLDAMIITPICPHTISNRAIVLQPQQELTVRYVSHLPPIEVTIDGIPHCTLATGETLTIRPAQRRFRLVVPRNHDGFATLRSKLGWSGTLTQPLSRE